MVLRPVAAVVLAVVVLAGSLLVGGCAHRTDPPRQPAAPSGDPLDNRMNHYGGTPSTKR